MGRGDHLGLIKVRQPAGCRPKYAEIFRSADHPPRIYPGPGSVRVGRPLVLVEGEFDALLLGQALGELAAVVTLGGASIGHDSPILLTLLKAAPWFLATDADPAGDKAADAWSAYATVRRVRPPSPFKDWTEAGTDAPGTVATRMDLSRWWTDILVGDPAPPLFTAADLGRWRWGPAIDDPEPGIVIPRGSVRRPTDPEAERAAQVDPYAMAEREAIQAELVEEIP